MSSKWSGNSSEFGILRKSEFKEKKEELFVFGYSCKLFRDDEKALHIDQGKHLIPWMGDETLKIDRYDARGALHDVSRLEAPPGGYDWRVELTRAERDVEQLCDEERYRALHTNEDEEEMYREEELKRLHAAGYGQVGFNYDTAAATEPVLPTAEVDEPFEPTPSYRALFSPDMPFPDTEKLNAIIEKTAKFIASQGGQMEILIKAKQGDNPQFQFLNRDCDLNRYYVTLIGLIRAGKWPEKTPDVAQDKSLEHEDYLHPSLASAVIESAPSIPSIHYRPSADCDYTMLISKMRGEPPPEEGYAAALAPGEVAPPGTEPLPPRPHADIAKPPVMYNALVAPAEPLVAGGPAVCGVPPPPPLPPLPPPAVPQLHSQYAAFYQQYIAHAQQHAALEAAISSRPPPAAAELPAAPAPQPTSGRSTGLSLMKNYNTDSDSDISDCDDSSSTEGKETKDRKVASEQKVDSEPKVDSKPISKTVEEDVPKVVLPPEDIQQVIDKMAAYVARNGAEFAEIVRAKRDPRFTFLDVTDKYHGYYKEMLREKRGEGKARIPKQPVSFSIKKLKEPEPVLPKPALPYESSSDEEGDNDKQTDAQTDNKGQADNKDSPKNDTAPVQNATRNNIAAVNHKIDGSQNLATVKVAETPKLVPKPAPKQTAAISEVKSPKRDITSVQVPSTKYTSAPKIETKKSPEIKVDTKEIEKNERLKKIESKKSKDKKEHQEKRKSIKSKDKREEIKDKREITDKREEIKDKREEIKNKREAIRDKREEIRDKREESRTKREEITEKREKITDKREKKRDKDSNKEQLKSKITNDELESEIISLEDNDDDDECIDLTGELSDSKVEADTEVDRSKQAERRRRAVEFLRKVGVDPGAAALPASSLASAMVDTLQSMRKKKEEEEEKRRKREKRKHREKHGREESHRKSKRRKYKSSDDEDSDRERESSKKKKRKKDKKSSKSKKKKAKEVEPETEDEEIDQTCLNIDLTTTLKGLRTSSPTKELVLQDLDVTQQSFTKDSSSSTGDEWEEEIKEKKKDDREYSEGEWSSDSEKDSESVPSRNGD